MADRACKHCGDAVYESGRKSGNLCLKHYRFTRMREQAGTAGKYVPEMQAIEDLWVKADGFCPTCDSEMRWLRSDSPTAVVSLQHDRDGRVRLLCFSCNARHRNCRSDDYYDTYQNLSHQHCGACKQNLPVEHFHTNKANINNRRPICKACCRAQYVANKPQVLAARKIHYDANRERLCAEKRAARARKKAAKGATP